MVKTKQQGLYKFDAYFLPDSFLVEFPDMNIEFDKTYQKSDGKSYSKSDSRPDSKSDSKSDNKSDKELETRIKVLEDAFLSNKYSALFYLGFSEKEKWFSPSVEYLYKISETLISKISKLPEIELVRENILLDIPEDELLELIEEVPFAVGMEYVDKEWISDLWEKLLDVFRADIKSYDRDVAKYFTEHSSKINVVGRVFFHLVENNDEEFSFAFMATYSTKPVKSKRAVHTPLKNALKEFDGNERKLLELISTVVKVSEKSDFISKLIESGELFSPIKLTKDEAYIFLKETSIYEESGIMCRIPDWWRKKRSSIKLSVIVGEKEPSKLGLNALLDFNPSIFIGDDKISKKELKSFLDMAEGLVQYKGKWVEINKKKIEEALNALDKLKEFDISEDISLSDALKFELDREKIKGVIQEDIEISFTNGEWLKSFKSNLTDFNKMQKPELASTFKANLRPYQETGYYWINQMAQFGFGACLADDMGLGKTVQVIAFLEKCRVENCSELKHRKQSRQSALLVLPASLIGNWQNEIEKFAPQMPYQVLHN